MRMLCGRPLAMTLAKFSAVIAAALLMPGDASFCGTAYARPGCCKMCKKGKACGDTCIAETSRCSRPPGCACNG